MSAKVSFELVSPDGLTFSQEVDMVVVPGRDGDIGVLSGHAPVMSEVRPGAICVFEGNDVSKRIFVAGGFAEVTPERCTVLSEDTVDLEELSVAAVQEEIRDHEDDVTHATEEAEKEAAEKALEIARAKLEVVQDPPY